MNKHNYDYYLNILTEAGEILIGITYAEHIFLWLLFTDHTVFQAGEQMRLRKGGGDYYSRKLRNRFEVANVHCMTAMFRDAYPFREDENGKRIEGKNWE